MFIRRTNTRNRVSGEAYFSHRLVETSREGNAVKQRTLLNLGSHFNLPQVEWPRLVARIEQLLHGQGTLLSSNLSEQTETLAQRYAAQLIASRREITSATATSAASGGESITAASRYVEVDLSTLEQVRPRTVGVEHMALASLRQLGFEEKLVALGFNKPQIAAAVGNVIGRMAAPASELATHTWLQQTTALGELIDYDYEGMDLQRLYRSADQLLKHRDALESHLFGAAKTLFSLSDTITLYDLTNTYFEGIAAGIKKAKRGRSKEKRSDCPLVTLGLVLDVSGFPKHSRIFEGNVTEAHTLEEMLKALNAMPGATVVMDAGIASEANLVWLKLHGYDYVVVSRKPHKQFDPDQATEVKTAGEDTIQVQRVLDETTGEILLYCYSSTRAEKDRAIDTTKAEHFEAALQKLATGLTKPRGAKDAAKIQQRIGRAKQKYARAAQHYAIDVVLDASGKTVTGISWIKKLKSGTAATHPGVYCLRTTLTALAEAELWRIYSMLTNLEAVFRSLKTDLGLRPVHHQIERRVEGHLFISVLAYYFVHTIRLQLKAQGINDSWQTLRNTLSTQMRITATLQRRDGRTAHIRKATRPEPAQQKIHAALKLSANPGGTQQTTV
jgi:transposase